MIFASTATVSHSPSPRALNNSPRGGRALRVDIVGHGGDLLNAAGTPMIRPLPEANSFAKLTLVPGVASVSSTEGIESPVFTMMTDVVLKLRGRDDLYERRLRVTRRDFSMKFPEFGEVEVKGFFKKGSFVRVRGWSGVRRLASPLGPPSPSALR